ncbi:hypothetical protein [Thermofilum sp.]|uniref:hypothetical protein n=1 Tax=Thermofilum sp. TaxID=1961369 RepID=UPI00319E1F6F
MIAFVGTVGSGKSTQMRLLASDLRRRRVKVKVSCLKTGHIFAYFLEVILAKMVAGKRRDVYPIRALLEEKPHFFNRIFRLWLALDVISVALKFLFSIYLPLKLGYVVLVEEYIPATISDYIYLSKIIGFTLGTRSFAITFPLKLMHLGGFTQIVFLDAENSELKCRWKRRRSFDERNDYLDMQRTVLLSISRRLSSNRLLYIDVSKQTIEETHQLIRKQLMSKVK